MKVQHYFENKTTRDSYDLFDMSKKQINFVEITKKKVNLSGNVTNSDINT